MLPHPSSKSHHVRLIGSLFTSAKTAMPVAIRSSLAAQALVQATLGHSVLEISPGFSIDGSGRRPVEIDAILTCFDGRHALIVAPAELGEPDRQRIVRDLAAFDLKLRALDQSDIAREPFATNACLVWAYAGKSFSASDVIRVLHHLGEFGPSPIIDVASSTVSQDGVAAVMAMCCRGLIDLDLLRVPLGPYTDVRQRRTV